MAESATSPSSSSSLSVSIPVDMNTDAARERLALAIIELKRHIARIQGQQSGRQENVVLAPHESLAGQDVNSDVIVLESAQVSEQEEGELENLKNMLDGFEAQLRDRGEWREPASTTNTIDANSASTHDDNTNDEHDESDSIEILDLQDLQTAISLLSDTISLLAAPLPYSSPKFMTSVPWQFDPSWCEFFYRSPFTDGHILYISHWVYNASDQAWMHIQRPQSTTPEHESLLLGPWEDWSWDEEYEEWFSPCNMGIAGVEEEGVVARWAVCEWRWDGVEGFWRYLGRRAWW